METNNSQLRFFQFIKSKVSANIAFVDEIADLLSISNDSAYRRIRADKPISFDDLQKLCLHIFFILVKKIPNQKKVYGYATDVKQVVFF